MRPCCWPAAAPWRLLLLLIGCGTITQVEAGNCWQAEKNGRCTSLLAKGISQEACCAKGPHNTAWSDQEFNQPDGMLFYYRTLGGGVPCKPCKGSCSKVKCPRGEKCRRRDGVPRCVCAPKCRRLRAGRGPVCGTDNRTYRSHCKLLRRQCRKKNNLKVSYKGPCQTSCESVTCARKNEQCVLDQNRMPHCVPCLRRCSKRSRIPEPICGVNGVTYKNRCQARRAACLHGSAIPIAYRGRCRAGLTCSRLRCRTGQRCLFSLKTRTPRCANCNRRCRRSKGSKQIKVCGSNNVTYRSWCHLMKDSCATGLVIEVMHHGKCFPRRFAAAAGDNATAPFSDLPFLHN